MGCPAESARSLKQAYELRLTYTGDNPDDLVSLACGLALCARLQPASMPLSRPISGQNAGSTSIEPSRRSGKRSPMDMTISSTSIRSRTSRRDHATTSRACSACCPSGRRHDDRAEECHRSGRIDGQAVVRVLGTQDSVDSDDVSTCRDVESDCLGVQIGLRRLDEVVLPHACDCIPDAPVQLSARSPRAWLNEISTESAAVPAFVVVKR